MDRRSAVQDVHRCDLCETAIVHSYCDICHINLCKSCIGEHISDEYEKHKIVRYKDRKSTVIYQKCAVHSQKNCKYQCKNCDNLFVCSSCTASEQHRGHIFVEVLDVYKTKKGVIDQDEEKLKYLITPKYEGIAIDLENRLANLDGGYEKLIKEISKQGEQWHREIDFVINKVKTEINEIKVKHREILQKHLDEIKQIRFLMNKTQLAIKELKESTEVSSIIQYSSKLREFSKLPPNIKVSLPTFIPKPIDREKLYRLFGQITPLSTATEENILSLNQQKIFVRDILDEPELVFTIRTGSERLRSVSCLGEDKVWTSGQTDAIKCLSTKGSLLQEITTISKGWTSDVAVNSDEDLLYCDHQTSTVNKVKNGGTKQLIKLEKWTPINLCVTSTGDLLVAMYSDNKTLSKVVRYSGYTCREKQTIQFDIDWKPIYSWGNLTKYITENRNHDICVADCGAGEVVVVNQDGKLRWRYTGHPSVTKTESFKPRGITTDSRSRVLTADFENHCIHILGLNGQFLRYIDNCDLRDPFGLCVDNNDNLFVCEYFKGNVKKIRYLK